MNSASRILIRGYFRKKKKEWKAVSILMFFCVTFFVTITTSCINAISSIEQYTKEQYGVHQFQAFNVSAEQEKHPKADVGVIELQGYFVNEVSLYHDTVILGTVDESARKIGYLSITEGRMPKKNKEIAIEASILKRMNLDLTVGDLITIPVYWIKDGKYQPKSLDETFVITGIIKDYSRIWTAESSDPYNGFPGVWLCENKRSDEGIRVELIHFADIETQEQADTYYQELAEYYGDAVVSYNINNYMASESDSVEIQKGLYLSGASIIIGIVIIVIMVVGIISILSLGIEERRKQQKILHQFGMRKRERFVVLCKQIYGAAIIGLIPGFFVSMFLSQWLKDLLLHFLGIYIAGNISFTIIGSCIIPIMLTVGIVCIVLYKMMENKQVKTVKKSKKSDYIQRICNGSFHMQRLLSIILLVSSLLIIVPVQMVLGFYQEYFTHPLEKDVNINLCSNLVSGCLAVSEGRQGVTLRDYEDLNKIDGLENMTYAMQIEAAKILLSNADMEDEFNAYSSDRETVPKIENVNTGTGTDYVARDKKYYGYPEESVLIPCTIQGVDWDLVNRLSVNLEDGTLDEQKYESGEIIYAVVWEEEYEKAPYPIRVGDEITLTNLVQTEVSSNYWEKPDEAKRVDTLAKVGGIIKVPLELKEELGCTFTYGSFTFLRSLNALEEDGHDISFQGILYDYSDDADMDAIDNKIKEILSHYSFVGYESKYEKLKAEKQFEIVVFILAGSIWSLGVGLSILLVYQKVISTLLLKKRQLHMMWCIGMHKRRLKEAVNKENIWNVSVAMIISLMIALISGMDIKMTILFIVGNGIMITILLVILIGRYIERMEF